MATKSFVLDASIALIWGFEDQADAYAEAILDQMSDFQAHVPSLWPLEVANALLRAERHGQLTQADSSRFLGLLGGLSIEVDEETVTLAWSDTMHLARAHALTSYDASYLELAIRLGLPLATKDHELKAAAGAVGVSLFKPV